MKTKQIKRSKNDRSKNKKEAKRYDDIKKVYLID